METRTLEVLKDNLWEQQPWGHLKNGDIFRLYNPDGTRVSWEEAGVVDEFIALGDAVQDPVKQLWEVSAIPREESQ